MKHVLVVSLLATLLGGCVATPGGWHDGYRDRAHYRDRDRYYGYNRDYDRDRYYFYYYNREYRERERGN